MVYDLHLTRREKAFLVSIHAEHDMMMAQAIMLGLPTEVMLLFLLMANDAKTIAIVWAIKRSMARRTYFDVLPNRIEASLRDPNRVRNLKMKLLNEKEGFEGKRRPSRRDHKRARICVRKDYFGWRNNPPNFNDLQFERHFAVTKSMVEDLLLPAVIAGAPEVFLAAGRVDPVTKKEQVDPIVRVLNVLQILRFGTSKIAFENCYQMGETTVQMTFAAFVRVIATDPNIGQQFFRRMTRADARRVSDMHKRKHGIPLMVMMIDCMHVRWKNCPKAWAGSLAGKEGKPTLVLEAGSDSENYFWHAAFGYPGTNNDIDTWEASPLSEDMRSGHWKTEIDPVEPVEIGGELFIRYYSLVDGIYPRISRFVKTFSDPVGQAQLVFSDWQESTRKGVECSFGILQSKFRCITRPIEDRDAQVIQWTMHTCIVMHNMMVRHRVDVLGGVERSSNCTILENVDPPRLVNASNQANVQDHVDEEVLEERLEHMVNHFYGDADAITGDGEALFNNDPEHSRLQQAIVRELASQGRRRHSKHN
jgi:hypothetical protein